MSHAYGLKEGIEQVAVALQRGAHYEVEQHMKVLMEKSAVMTLQHLLQFLEDHLANQNEQNVYSHFVALKFLCFYLSRYPSQWTGSGEEMIRFLLNYGRSLSEVVFRRSVEGNGEPSFYILIRSWRPAVSELATCFAVTLKLRCALIRFPVADVIKGLLSMLSEDTALLASLKGSVSVLDGEGIISSAVVIHRAMVQRTVEEFGLYDRSSRRRGLPVRQHIHWRREMQEGGLLDLLEGIGNVVLHASANGEGPDTLIAAFSLLVSALSWFKYRYVDAEEDAAEEDTTDTYEVRGPRWLQLLLGESSSHTVTLLPSTSLGGMLLNHFNALVETLCAVVDDRSGFNASTFTNVGSVLTQIVHAIRLTCSFHVDQQPPAVHALFSLLHFGVCLHLVDAVVAILQRTAQSSHGEEVRELFCSFLPVAANGMRRLLSNFPDIFLQNAAQETLKRFSETTETLFCLSSFNYDIQSDTYQAAVEEALHGWLTLVFLEERAIEEHEVFHLGTCTSKILLAYLKCIVLPSTISQGCDEAELMEERSVVNTCHQMAGRIGRLSAVNGLAVLQEHLNDLAQRLRLIGQQASEGTVRSVERLAKPVLIYLRVLRSFIGDPSEGELPSIPRCFLDGAAGTEGMLSLMMSLLQFYTLLISSPLSPVKSTHEVMAEVLERYIGIYVEAEDSNELFTKSFNNGVDIVSFSLDLCYNYLINFPTSTTSTVICRLFSVATDKSEKLRKIISTLPAFLHIVEFIKEDSSLLPAKIRGQLAACAATCITPIDLFSWTPQLTAMCSVNPTTDVLVYRADYLIGMAQYLQRADTLHSQFPSFYSLAQSILENSFSKPFTPRPVVIRATQLTRKMFVSFSVAVDDDGVRSLLYILQNILQHAASSLQQDAALWYEDEAAIQERHELLLELAGLLYDIALWKDLDCFLSEQEIAPLETATIDMLAFLLENITAEERKIPEIDSALFNALEHCANSFVMSFVGHPKSIIFMNAILYSIHQQNPAIQLVGVHVISAVSACLSQDGEAEKEEVISNFMGLLLRAAVQGQASFRNTKHLCREILRISRSLSDEHVHAIFAGALEEYPQYQEVFHRLYEGLLSAVQNFTADSKAVLYFEEVVENSVALLDGMHLVPS